MQQFIHSFSSMIQTDPFSHHSHFNLLHGMRGQMLREIDDDPLKADSLVPVDRITVLLVEEQDAMHLQAFAAVFAHPRHNKVEADPVQDAEGDQ